MSPQRGPWTGKDTAECLGMVVLTAGALAACTGHLSIDDVSGYAQTAGDLAVPVAAGLVGTVAVLVVLLVVVRHLRAVAVAAAWAYWLYRRRWASVLADLGLCEDSAAGIRVPRLVSVVRHGSEDTVSVRMLPGQSAATFHERSAALAAEFGASSARVKFGAQPHRDIVIVFDRHRAPRRGQLALPAPQPHPLPLYLPQHQQQRHAGPATAIQISGLRLQIVWARIQRTGHDGSRVRLPLSQRYGLRGELRWATWATAN
ncbi:hypothetical protein AB0H49_34125 [Nocardia sp. NPDC050713]|uniref:hypothetical protein n=1 Tax=Nocardia sp. NPDC050713 TaxID=3154511 RepID=UPI0033EAE2FA